MRHDPLAIQYPLAMMTFFYLLLLALLLYVFRVNIQNALTVSKMKDIPMLPQGIAQPILFSKIPRDQAMEQLIELCPEAETAGMFQTQFFFRHTIIVTDYDLIKELTEKSGTYVSF